MLEPEGRGGCDGNDEDGEDNREDDYAYNGDGRNDEDGDGGDEQEEGRSVAYPGLLGRNVVLTLATCCPPTPAPAILKTVARQGHRSLMRRCLYPQDIKCCLRKQKGFATQESRIIDPF